MQERRPVGATLTGLARNPLLRVGALTAITAVAIDQITKSLALSRLEGREPVHLVWTLQLTLAYNDGVAFSLGRGSGLVVVPIALIVIGVVVYVGRSMEGALSGICLGLIVGGAVGNVADRLFRGHGGAVIDFIDLQWWPVFNVADSCIVCGGIGLALLALRRA